MSLCGLGNGLRRLGKARCVFGIAFCGLGKGLFETKKALLRFSKARPHVGT